jgi:hypothetical protein
MRVGLALYGWGGDAYLQSIITVWTNNFITAGTWLHPHMQYEVILLPLVKSGHLSTASLLQAREHEQWRNGQHLQHIEGD